jgi:tetratricopeptide (TPR) repeat protein
MRTVSLLLLLASSALAQTLYEANSLLHDQKFPAAAKAFTSLTKSQPDNGAVWTGLGEAELQQKHFSQAEAAYQKAKQLNFRPAMTAVNLARVAAASGDNGKVYAILNDITSQGLGQPARNMILAYPEFEPLATDPTFTDLLAKMKPCTSPEYRQFDFWLGSWEVHDPKGNLVGHNDVTLEQDGCLIVEHWKSLRTETGTSFNYYDNKEEKWHQLYIANNGIASSYPPMAGDLQHGKMVLLTDNDPKNIYRWTWTPLASKRVRQMAEQSRDGGVTWTMIWDSIYVKQ